MEEIAVSGWMQSTGTVPDLIGWIERKTAPRGAARIKKSRIEGQDLIITVSPQDVPIIKSIDGYQFAKANIHFRSRGGVHSGPPAQSPFTSGYQNKQSSYSSPNYRGQIQNRANTHQSRNPPEPELKGSNIRQRLQECLARRYDPDTKLLDLSALGTDPELSKEGLNKSPKFFPALMKVCDDTMETRDKKKDMVESVTLANNDLDSVTLVTTLAATFIDLKNLDLSNNRISSLSALEPWRKRFPHLDHLILSGNPIEQSEPNYVHEIIQWFRSLRILNGVQVRSDEEAANKSKPSGKLPFPVASSSFRDEGDIGKNFLLNYFVGFDTDRAALVNMYYDDASQFSLSIATKPPPNAPADAPQAQRLQWDRYIKLSRNMKRVTQLPARMTRLFPGRHNIQQCFSSLPLTRHPPLQDIAKWCLECESIENVPDVSGQSVGGLMITAHAEFDEIDVSNGQVTATRSFDRTWILGPGASGVRVVSDLWLIRAYGGIEAWQPVVDQNSLSAHVNSLNASQPTQPSISGALGAPASGKTDEQVLREQMCIELSRRTGMTLDFSKQCLEETAWNFAAALAAFDNVRGSLPPTAFMQP